MAAKRGMLIAFEGLDRSGKSTQCELLVKNLDSRGEKVYHTRFPNRSTATGQMINSYLSGETHQDDHAIHLLFSANRWESAKEIEEYIKSGVSVIIDRYYYSGCVYSAAKQIPSMDLAWCRHPEVGLPRPDLCMFLDISTEAAAKRGGFGTERYEREELQGRVRKLYAEMRSHHDENDDIVVIDGAKELGEVQVTILAAVDEVKARISKSEEKLRHVRPW